MKHIPFLAVLALAACVALAPVRAIAEDWPSLEKKMRDAYGKYCGDIKDMKMVQKLTIATEQGEIPADNVFYMKGERFRAETDMSAMMGEGMPAMKTIVISDGAKTWVVSPMGTMEVPAEEGAKYSNEWFCGRFIPVKAEIVGSEAIGGVDCWKVKCLDESTDFGLIWIDKARYNAIKWTNAGEKGEEGVALFSDFRKVVGDLEMPYRMEMYQGQKLVTTVIVEMIAINTGLSDDLFDPAKTGGTKGGAEKPGFGDMMKKAKEAAEAQAKGKVKK